MPITDWPLKERPRERLLKLGAHALSNAELLAIFLRTGIKGKTALDLALELLSGFGSLRVLLEAPLEVFCQYCGLGDAKYAQLQAALELTRRYIQENLQSDPIFSNAQQVKNFLLSQMCHYKREVFACLFLNTQHKLICFEKIFYGTLNNASIHPREIVKRALELNAAAVILAHNHPSGKIEPSLADKEITQQLIKALALVEIHVLDHMIVGNNCVLSFSELGIIA